ncbi:DUF937 domain-containing protein [Facklamia languida]|uniref:DUF937 domain-containing protein n=1 Tax=Facklamia languida CCUG 37842 TaxID=883113 RepID=H3NKW9_9LACT|nr:DUF937 domain-containing protein [Facklamia languida]EHR36247.1 hypothetical protein HMPREF9708_01508 [Facklamia languida CCUG 37842]
MGLFDQFNPLDLLLNDNQEATGNLADKAGLDRADFGKIATMGLPLILSQINRNNQSQEGLESFNNALKQHEDVNNYQSFDELTRQVDTEDGDKILGHVFQDKDTLIERIANTLGLTPAAVKRALVVIAPLILKYLAERKSNQNLDREGVQRETQSTIDRMNDSLRQHGQESLGHGGPLDSLLEGLNQGSNPQNQANHKNSQGGLLGNILKNIFK